MPHHVFWEAGMAIGVILDTPGVTKEQYERVGAQLQPVVPPELLMHTAGPREGGWVVVEVWESQEAMQRFVEQYAAPALQAAGYPMAQPQVFAVHTLFGARVRPAP
jgi:hypothetical protein